MMYIPFYEYFPEIAEKETRSATAMNNPNLPSADYGFVETYCNDPDCDCRRVIFHVVSSKTNQPMAVIAYGWESKEFYAEWMGDDDPRMLKELKGPSLTSGSPQSKYAPELLKLMEYIIGDKAYVQRLKRHYKMFKDHIKDNKAKTDDGREVSQIRSNKTGRNDPCPCGSGRKYKKCCMGKLIA